MATQVDADDVFFKAIGHSIALSGALFWYLLDTSVAKQILMMIDSKVND